MTLIDGSGQKVLKSEIHSALMGNTSMVQTKDRQISILYDEDNAEIDISVYDGKNEKFFIEGDSDIREAISTFIQLLSQYGY